jgi:amino acid adenylation domain-containing protein
MQPISIDARAQPAANAAGGIASVCELFERQADATPDATALIADGRTLTYRALEARVSQLARFLRDSCRIGPEAVVALLLGRSERMLVSMLAVLKAGGAYVPISPDYPASRVRYILDDAAPRVLLTEERCRSLIDGYAGGTLSWDEAPWAAGPQERLAGQPRVRDLAYIMYTSGSTGQPKGVLAEHGNLSNFLIWCRAEYRSSRFSAVYAVTPYGFDLSNVELFFPLTVGRPIRLLPSTQTIGLYLRRDCDVLINTVPSVALELLKTPALLERISVLNLGGEAVPPSLAAALRGYPHLEVRNMYGPTETTSTAINYRMDLSPSVDVLIGLPIDHTIVYIVDERGRQVRDGVKGEIWIGGRGVARGYLNREQLTSERFIEDPFAGRGRLYRTGDIGARLPDGNFRYFGRDDNQVKIRGCRIELDEVAAHLAAHPGVREAIAGIRRTCDGDRLIAVVRPNGAGAEARALTTFLRGRLPGYMVPDEIVARDMFPLTATGKIDRAALFPREEET